MRKFLLCLVLLLFGLSGGMQLLAQSVASEAVPGVVRVKLQREVASRISKAALPMSGGVVTTGVTPLDRANLKVKATGMKRLIPYSPKFEEKHKAAGLDLWYEIRYDGTKMSPLEARNLYKTVPGIQVAETVRPAKLIGGESFRVLSSTEQARLAARSATLPFNDPLLGDQWHYYNDGTLLPGAVAGADANVWEAWKEETGKSDVLVAIIDGGFQYDHPDLADNAYVNTAELNGQPGVDDDGNGYVDDVYGYNFVIGSADVSAHSHGTHVAGTVGAVNNNGVGVAGVAGGNGQGGVKMLLCQVFDNRSNTDANYAGALVYAADMGADIAQCSWGWSSAGYYEQSVLDAIDYFTQQGGGKKLSGGLCIFANGNNGDEGDYYPACYDKVVAVGAMTAMKTPAGYSSYGDWADITAPGGDMDYGERYGVLSTLPNGTYGYNEGTSMACPHVSGIAALVLSKYGSKNFTNENLRQQLLASVNDFYTSNPSAAGKFGSGYIDAYKALQMGSGAAPQAVGDYKLTPSQDNILIEWNIPDAEEKSVDHHVIYYSTTPFAEGGDMAGVKSVTVDTKFHASGDAMQYELPGLTSLTTYYVAIVAVNRYGNASSWSEVKTARTNAGPEVTLSKDQLELNVSAGESQTATDEFVINNVGEGILKYNLSAATQSNPSISLSSLSKVTPGKLVPARNTVTMSSVSRYPVVSADYKAEDYPVNLAYTNDTYFYIGDSNTSLPNAAAQYFYVDPSQYPDGFNLTHINVGGAYGENAVVEIYDGASAISKASLLQSLETFFAYNYDMSLNEQMFFTPGSAFWVVVKFPAGQTNPLGAGQMPDGTDVKHYSFYSSDNGNTWTQLSEVLRHGNLADFADDMTWSIKAVSQNPDWSSVLNPEPAEGTVRPGESQTVTVKNDGQKLVNGTYTYNLYVNTNQTDMPKQRLTATMTVSGNKPELVSARMIDFGALLVGQEKTVSVEIVNSGYGAFGGTWGSMFNENIQCNSDQFEVPSYMPNLSARSTATLDVTFKPTKAGNQSATVTLASHDGTEYSFVVRGVASMPAKISVTPTEIDLGDLEVGGTAKTASFTIKNEGEYPLQYVFPKFTDETIEGAGKVHKFGYTYISNMDGSDAFAYDNNPDLNNETDITSQFNSNNWQSSAIDLGFKFPFFGTEYTKVHVSSHGGVAMQTIDGRISCMVPTAGCVKGLGYISAYANSGELQMGANSKVSYGKQDGKFTVKFKDVLTNALDGNGALAAISFHLSLCPDGSVEMFYDNYQPYEIFSSGQNIFVGVSDINCSDPLVVTDNDQVFDNGSQLYQQICTGTAIKILAPSKPMISALSSTSGVVNIGESKEITLTAAATEGAYAGELVNTLTLLSNDPEQPGTNIIVKSNIVGENLKPVAELGGTSVEFGKVFRTSKAVRSILLSNNGTDKLVVKGVSVAGGKFSVAEDIRGEFEVAPGHGKDLNVTLPTETEGAVSDELVIALADRELRVPVSGEVIGVPQWAMTPAGIEETVAYGRSANTELQVSNAGNEPLTFNIEPSDYVTLTDQLADENSSVGYVYKSATDYSDISYEWVDLTADPAAEHKDMTYYLDKTDYHKVELPFEFPFYGKKYRTMWICNTGFVSFSEHADYKEFPAPPTQLPSTETFYTNIIAPFWGNHSMDTSEESGTYYKAEDDHVVVSFVNYGNSMMIGMDFQLLLYKDGRYKFQYHLQDDGYMVGLFGLAGIQDETGQTGIGLPDQCINTGNAVEFYPVKNFTVAAGGNVTIPVEVKTDKLAGVYESELKLNTNVPTQPVVTLPVKLTVTGTPDASFPEKLEYEAVANCYTMPTLTYEFEVANHGSAAFNITNVEFNPQPDFSDPDFDWESYNPVPAYLFVYATVYDEWFGQWNTGWTQWTPGMTVEVGKEPVKFQIQAMDEGMPRVMDLPVTMTLEGLDYTEKVIPFKLTLTDAPVMTFDQSELVIDNVPADYTGNHSFTISNEGQYKLTYSLRLDPNGIGETPAEEDGGGGIAPCANNVLAKPMTGERRAEVLKATATSAQPCEVFEGHVYDVPQIDCSNLLYYPILDVQNPSSLIMGTGSSNLSDNFLAATRFTAPAEGFNLSHLYFTGTVGNLENVDIEAAVIGSSDVTSDRVIGRGKLRVEKETPSFEDTENPENNVYYGVPRMLEFDRPVYICPNDTFYVVLKYPAGYPSSALLAAKADRVREGRYMAWLSTDGWIDLGKELEQQYGSFGYFMTCVEMEPGKPWIKLIDTVAEGEIAVGESREVKVGLDAASAYFDKDNKAVVVIKSNDPAQPLVNYPIVLNRNAAPAVTAPEATTTVPEGGTAGLEVSVADAEGDAFTVSVADESGISSVSSARIIGAEGETDAAVTDGTVSVPAGSALALTMTLAPGFGTAGLHYVNITATDAAANSATVAVPYYVEYTNRAPVYRGEAEMTVAAGRNTGVISYDALFTDPDDDTFTCTAAMPDNGYAEIMTNNSGFIISGKAAGTAELVLTATDAAGASTEVTIPVIVGEDTGIGTVTGGKDISVYPNPVKTVANVTLGRPASSINYYVYDSTGRLCVTAHADNKPAGTAQQIDMSHCAPGVCHIKVVTAEGTLTVSVMKK